MTRFAERWSSRNQAGASLYIALVAIIVVVGVIGSLSLLSATSIKATGPFVTDQQKRAAGDSALKGAVNYVARNTTLGRDPGVYPADPTCGYRVPSSETGSVPVTVTCAAMAGAGSGVPAETGKVPDQALLLLGQKYGDVPTYSPCTGSTTDRRNTNGREWGLTLDPTALQKSASTTECVANNGAINSDRGFWVKGDIKSNAPIKVASGARLTVDGGTIQAGTSPYFYLNGAASSCSGTIATSSSGSVPCAPLTAGNRISPSGPATSPFDPGESLLPDPALDATRGAEWRQGTINWNKPYVSFNGADPVELTDTTTIVCNKYQNLIRFYPGLYRSAMALNRIFADPNCSRGAGAATGNPKSGIFWFGPAENNSNSTPTSFSLALLAAGGKPQQGVYAFDFRDAGTGSACAALPNTNSPHRWCLYPDGTNDNGGVLIGGWPAGWDPAAVLAAPLNSTSKFTSMTLTQPTDYSDEGSRSWSTPTAALTYGDGNAATYAPTLGFSANRSIRLWGFGTVSSVESGGNIQFTVRHQESNSALLNSPELVLSTEDRGSLVTCGTFTVPKSPDNGSTAPDALVEHTISASQATDTTTAWTASKANQLRSCFANPERIRNLSVRWQVSGDSFNRGRCSAPSWLTLFCSAAEKPRVFVDGIKITVDAPTGGFFTEDAPVPATYCDGTMAGVQFIFGGDSTVHTGTAAMQLCAGPAPSDPERYQQIALWAQPVNFLTKQSGSNSQAETRVGKTGNVSLTPTTVSTAVTDCGPVVFGIGCFKNPEWVNSQWATRPNNPYTNPLAPSTPVKEDFNAGRAVSTAGTSTFSGFGKVAGYGSTGCQVGQALDRERNLCIDAATQVISKVQLKVNYTTACPDASSSPSWVQTAFNWVFCSGLSSKLNYEVSGTGWTCSGDMPAIQGSKLSWWYADVTASCFTSDTATRLSRLNDANLKVKLTLPCSFCTNNQKQIEGVELLTSISSTSSAMSIAPATGCRVGPIGFGAGVGDGAPLTQDSYLGVTTSPDCAVISSAPPVMAGGEIDRPGGRVSVQGTIYAPSDAVEIADGDVMYPFASRGMVARHLRVRGMQFRPPYDEPSIENDIDKTANSRQVELTACVRQSTNTTTKCGSLAGDQVVAKAGVRFAEDTSASSPASPPSARMRVPQVIWWNTERGQ